MIALVPLAASVMMATLSSVLTFNVQFDATAAERSRTLDVIEQADADVLCLQEVTKGFVAVFKKRLATRYPSISAAPAAGTWGLLVASKYPVNQVTVFPVKPHAMPAMEATIHHPSAEVRLVCLHLFPSGAKRNRNQSLLSAMAENTGLRASQAATLAARYRSETRPLLVLGDFNEEDGAGVMTAMEPLQLVNACRNPDAACTATWPGGNSPWPAVAQVDHILGARLVFSGARTLRQGGSDHFPVRADFACAEDSNPVERVNR